VVTSKPSGARRELAFGRCLKDAFSEFETYNLLTDKAKCYKKGRFDNNKQSNPQRMM
jgi:hypothetical protein